MWAYIVFGNIKQTLSNLSSLDRVWHTNLIARLSYFKVGHVYIATRACDYCRYIYLAVPIRCYRGPKKLWGQVKWSADQQSCSSFCQRRQQGSLFNILNIFVSHNVHDDHRPMENNNIYLQDSHGLVELERLVYSYKTRMTTRPILSRTSTLSRSKKTTSLAQSLPLCGPQTLMLGTTVNYATPLLEKTPRLSQWMPSQVLASPSSSHTHQSVCPNHCSFCHMFVSPRVLMQYTSD